MAPGLVLGLIMAAEVSGSTPLTQRLRRVAARAIEQVIRDSCPPNIMPTLPPGASLDGLASGALAAALRELAADTQKHQFGYPLHDLSALADSIERGD